MNERFRKLFSLMMAICVLLMAVPAMSEEEPIAADETQAAALEQIPVEDTTIQAESSSEEDTTAEPMEEAVSQVENTQEEEIQTEEANEEPAKDNDVAEETVNTASEEINPEEKQEEQAAEEISAEEETSDENQAEDSAEKEDDMPAVPEETESKSLIPEEMEEVSESAEEAEATVSDTSLEDADIISDATEETAAEDELEAIATEGLLESVQGDYILQTDVETELIVPAGAGGTAYASYVLETASLLTFEFASTTAGGNVSISIKDIDNRTMWTDNWVNNAGSVTCSEFAESGEYTIVINKSSAADTNSYRVRVRPIISRVGELATRNNTANNAGVMTVGQEMTGIWSYQDIGTSRSDYYKFTLDQPGWATINFTNKSIKDMSFKLYGDDTTTENEVTAFAMTGPACGDLNEANSTTINRSGWLDAGVYFITIKGGAISGRYTLKVTNSPITITESEKNNTFAQAYNNGSELSLIGNRTTGLLSESNHEDCYWFSVPTATDVGFSLKIQFTGVNAAVYTREGKLVPGSSFGSNATTGSDGRPYTLEAAVPLAAGTYYLRISWSTGKYCGKYDVAGYRKLKISDVVTVLDGASLELQTIYTIYTAPVTSFTFILEREDPRYPGSGSYYPVGGQENGYDNTARFILPGNGNYRVHAAITDGFDWTDYWKYFSVTNMAPLKVESVEATSMNEQVTISATVSGTNHEVKATRFVLRNSSSVVVASYDGTNELSYVLPAPDTGTYTAEFACTVDGIIWEGGSAGVYVTAPSSLSFAPLSFQVKSDGTVTVTITQTSGNNITDGWIEFYLGSVRVAGIQTGSAKKVSTKLSPGTYTVHYAGYNGKWVDQWDLLTVPSSSVLNVSSLSASSDTTGRVFIQAKCSGGAGIAYGVYDIFKDSILQQQVVSTESAITWQAPANGTYVIHYVAYDGFTWADGWASVSVTIAPVAPLSIKNLKLTASGTTLACVAETNDDRPVDSVFVLYKDGNPIGRIDTKSRSCSFTHLPIGIYAVQYVVTDGKTWVETWKSEAVSTTLTINSVSAVKTGAHVNVNASVTSTTPVREAYMVLYNALGAEITRYVYSGSGEYLTHTFNVGETPAAIHYVVFDGLKWVEKWAPVT